MANKHILGTLLDATGVTPIANATIRFISTSTRSVVNSITTDYTTDSSGVYNFTVLSGVYTIQIRRQDELQFRTVCANAYVLDDKASTLEELIRAQSQIQEVNEGLIVDMLDILAKANTAASNATLSANNATSSATTATTKASEAATSAASANTSATNAAASATTATNKANEAATSASSANTSATNAAASAATATTKANAAGISATTASTKAGEASVSAANAATSATTASTKASEASASAANAATSAATAGTKASEAAESATTAATGAATATTKANDAEASATSAAMSESTAATSASTAAAKADEASTSATTAATKAGEAVISANSASAAATKAATSAEDAATSATNAVDSATTTTTKANEAAVSATSASTSATTATTKANEAAVSATAAAASATTAVNAVNSIGTSATDAATSAASASASATFATHEADRAVVAADRAEAAVTVSTGTLVDAGQVSLASGVLPPPLTNINSEPVPCFWSVSVGGTVNGITFHTGDALLYSTQTSTYVKINNTTIKELRNISCSGDATWQVSFDGSEDVTAILTLTDIGTGGEYTKVTVDSKGRVTSGSIPTTLAGYGITDAAPSSHIGSTEEAHGVVTTSVNGFMSASDKTKLNGVATGANNYVHPVSGVTAGTYKSVTFDSNGHAIAGTNPTTLSGYGITDAAASSHVGATGTAHGVASTSVAGFMSATDKTKLDGIAVSANNYTHPTSGVTSGTYKSVTVDANGHITDGTNPTTLAEYGITDAAKTHPSLNFGGSETPISTADFITQLINLGAFNSVYWCTKAAWSYADNNYITDTGVGVIQLSGCTVEVIGISPALCTIRIHTSPTVSLKWAVPNADFVYVNHGEAYIPKWHKIYNTDNKPTAADIGAAPSTHVGAMGTAHGVVTTTINGFMSSGDKTKLDGVATGATSNSTDAYLLGRNNHTGTQSISTVTGLTTELSTINTGLAGKLDKAGGVISGPITENIPTTNYTYTGDNITSITENYLDGVKTTSFQYTGDNITSMVEQYAGSTTTTTYVYDESGNLVSTSSTYA